jgi:BirA family biotin operon repressor/biotin-[acetyl-CoA-carboxylase] ligase
MLNDWGGKINLIEKKITNDQKNKVTKFFTLETVNTLFVGKVLKEFPKLASTNQYATDLLSKSKPSEGTVISTPNQYAGRGQIGSGWESEAGKNLNLSFIFYPTFLPIRKQFQLNQAISLAVRDCIAELVPKQVKIKWPNDIYIENKKVCGILIQNTLASTKITSSVIGIGINVNQTNFLTNPPNPTSLRIELGHEVDLTFARSILCEKMEKRYLQLKANRIQKLKQDYLNTLYRFDQMSLFKRLNEDTFYGKILGVEESGKLVIENEFGERACFAIKEVRFV